MQVPVVMNGSYSKNIRVNSYQSKWLLHYQFNNSSSTQLVYLSGHQCNGTFLTNCRERRIAFFSANFAIIDWLDDDDDDDLFRFESDCVPVGMGVNNRTDSSATLVLHTSTSTTSL